MGLPPSKKIKPVLLLYDLRKSVSEILNIPFFEKINHQIFQSDKKILALWANDCCHRILPYFEQIYPNDTRPKDALETLKEWLDTETFKMSIIRKTSLDAHAAAKESKEDYAKYIAHAAGQAVATAHVPTHALGCSVYCIRAVVAYTGNIKNGLINEKNWQLQHLQKIKEHLP